MYIHTLNTMIQKDDDIYVHHTSNQVNLEHTNIHVLNK